MNADADIQTVAEFRRQARIELIQRRVDPARRAQGLPARGLRVALAPEHRKQPVAQILVDPAALGLDRRADDAEELVEQEHDVVRQAALRQACEAAHIEEHDGQHTLDTRRFAGPGVRAPRASGRGRHQPRYGERRFGPRLAGKPDVFRRADAAERYGLGKTRQRQLLEPAVDPHPAGRAARAAAAHGRMRHAPQAADLQQRRSDRSVHQRPARVLDRDSLGPIAGNATRREQSRYGRDGRDEDRHRRHLDGGEHGLRLGVRPARRLPHVRDGLGRREGRGHLPAGHRESCHCQRRQKHRRRQEHRRETRIPGREPEPEVQADAGVRPHHQHERCLPHGIGWPQLGQRKAVGVVPAEQLVADPRHCHVVEQQDRDGQSAGDLKRLPGRQAQRRPRGQFDQRQADVDQKGTPKDDRTQRRARVADTPRLHGLHDLEADQSQGMVEEMRCRKGEQHQPCGQTQPLNVTAAQQDVHDPALVSGPEDRPRALADANCPSAMAAVSHGIASLWNAHCRAVGPLR